MNSPQKPPATGSGNLGHGDGGTAGQQSSSVSENRTLQSMFKLGKINFRFFDGTDSTESVRAWLFHSNMIFQIQSIHDNHKSQIAGLYMKGQALSWLMPYMQDKTVWPLWNEFCDDVIARFDDDSIHTPIMRGGQRQRGELAISYPTLAAAPHIFINAYKNALAIAVASEYSFPQADKVKEYLKDPSKFVVAVAAPAAGGGSAPAAAAKEEEKKEEVKEESEDDDMGFSLFH